MDNESAVEKLRSHGLRVTPQRIAVYIYLVSHRTHPSADEIYKALSPENPSFSKTTVYNTLETLCESGLAIKVTLGSGETRFDGCVDLHGHFKCRECGNIFDFSVDRLSVSGLDGFRTLQKDVYFGGVCPVCGKTSLK